MIHFRTSFWLATGAFVSLNYIFSNSIVNFQPDAVGNFSTSDIYFYLSLFCRPLTRHNPILFPAGEERRDGSSTPTGIIPTSSQPSSITLSSSGVVVSGSGSNTSSMASVSGSIPLPLAAQGRTHSALTVQTNGKTFI